MTTNKETNAVSLPGAFDRRGFLLSSAAVLGGSLVGVPLLAACSSDDSSEQPQNGAPAKGGALTMAIVGTLLSLDPPLINTVTFGSIVVPHLLQTFLNLTPEGKVEPMLAESYEVASDNVTWTLNLRKNVIFHDGSPWTAEVAKANLERYLGNPKFTRPQQYKFMTDFKAIDELTFQFKTTTPHSGTPHWLAWFAMGMHSGESLKKFGDDVALRGVGTGPFKVQEFTPNQRFQLVRNDDYWGEKPLVDSLNIVNVPDANGRATIVQSGQAQISLGIAPASVRSIESNKSLRLISAPSVRIVYIGLNCNNPILSDPRVRQAMNYAVDSEAIRKSVLLGQAESLKSIMPPQVPGYKEQQPYDFDPDKAKSLLDEAGWVAGSGGIRAKGTQELAVAIRTSDGYYTGDRATCEAVQQYLKDVGIKADIEIVEHDSYFAYLLDAKNAKTSTLNYGSYGGAVVDPTQSLAVFQSDLKLSGITGHFQRYSNPDYDDAFKRVLNAVADETELKKAAEDAQRIAWEGAPWIFLYTLNQVAATSAKTSGLKLTPAEGFDLTKVSVK